jgi:drug/metabolite transporter (DMT)-like permease
VLRAGRRGRAQLSPRPPRDHERRRHDGRRGAAPERAATWLALAYLVAVGSVLVFVLALVVLRHWTASRFAYLFVLVPLVTVALSAWLDDEPVGAGLVFGGLLVLAGVYVGALRPPSPSSPAPERR